ncbi:hypothetical protein [Pseudoneobacillus sp. C159]
MNILLPVIVLVLIMAMIYILKASRKYVTVKITHWLLMIYTGTLLLAMAISPMILVESPPKMENKQNVNLFESLMNGETHKVPMLAENSIPFDKQLLSIRKPVGSDDGTPVFIDRKTSDDGKIDAYVYGSGLEVNGFDFSKRLNPIQFQLSDNTLFILPPDYQEINVALIKTEFTINQFKEKTKDDNRMIGHEGKAVYLRVPQGLKIDVNSVPFTNVNK